MDVFDSEKRSSIMSHIKSKNTKPEMIVRSILHRLGYRFRIHRADLPGNPDVVLPKYHKVIFVHGCFWHGHEDCRRSSRPSTNVSFWQEKLDKNIERDIKNLELLNELGWGTLVVWQCELKDISVLTEKLQRFLQEGE